jgi:hypothetical protein
MSSRFPQFRGERNIISFPIRRSLIVHSHLLLLNAAYCLDPDVE